jgi:hypothetical protein
MVRIGVRRLEDPQSVYLSYLTASAHRDFFRASWWPSSRSITPVHLWRANHLGAGWDIASIDRFMDEAAKAVDRLVASAPQAERPGSPERRAWVERLLSSEWVWEFGVGRVSKALVPLLPELVPDLDPAMTPWAARTWLGLEAAQEPSEPARYLEAWELLEDVMILRGRQLGQVVGRLRRLAPGLAPVGRLGLVSAAFWDGFWAEAAAAARPAARRRRTSGQAATASGARGATPGAGSTPPKAPAARASRSAGKPKPGAAPASGSDAKARKRRATPASGSDAKTRKPRAPRSTST